MSFREVVDRTWRAREEAPAIATPRLGGPLAYWVVALESCQLLLERLTDELAGVDLESVIHPHPISGPLDVRQRYEFLVFHLDRQRGQVELLRDHPDFPAAESPPG